MNTVDYSKMFAHLHKQSNLFFAERFKDLGISAGQFPYLLVVCDNPGLTQDEIAAKTRTDKSTVAKMVGQLEKTGFLRRKENPDDGRSRCVFPTARGLETYPAIAKEKEAWHALLLENFTETEKLVLDILLQKLNIEPV